MKIPSPRGVIMRKNALPSPNEPRATLIGNHSLRIEGHLGLAEYSDDVIAVKTRGKIVGVYGEKLRCAAMTTQEILIVGDIQKIDFS